MEWNRSKISLAWVILAAFVSQNLVMPVLCTTEAFADQKSYYTPSTPSDPHTGTPSHGSSGNSHSHGGSHHGSSGSYGSTPSQGSGGSYGTPSHGSGGSYGTPSHGSSGSYGTPSHGSGGSYGPPSEGGGYYNSPPTHSTPAITPPTTPTYDPTPNVPDISTPTTPSTPMIPDPNSSPPFIGSWNFWRDHPESIWGVLGFFGTVGGVFGAVCTPVYGHDVSLQQALANTRNDGIGSLYREGTASLLNSFVNKRFPFTPQEVRSSFTAALVSDKAAAAQAEVFKLANEGRVKSRV